MYTTCRVGVLWSEISKHSKISPPPSLRSHLTSSPMGVLSGDYGTCIRIISSTYVPAGLVLKVTVITLENSVSKRKQTGL